MKGKPEYGERYHKLLGDFFKRKILKTPIMVSQYGGASHKQVGDVVSQATKFIDESGNGSYPDGGLDLIKAFTKEFYKDLLQETLYSHSNSHYEFYKLYAAACNLKIPSNRTYREFKVLEKITEEWKNLKGQVDYKKLSSVPTTYINVTYLYTTRGMNRVGTGSGRTQEIHTAASGHFINLELAKSDPSTLTSKGGKSQHDLFDLTKTSRAFAANSMHNFDSEVIKSLLILLTDGFGVHDCIVFPASNF